MTPFHARAKEAAEEYANSHGTLIGGAQFFDSTTYETFLAGAAFGRSAGLSEAADLAYEFNALAVNPSQVKVEISIAIRRLIEGDA